jgi:hypothetical protein
MAHLLSNTPNYGYTGFLHFASQLLRDSLRASTLLVAVNATNSPPHSLPLHLLSEPS